MTGFRGSDESLDREIAAIERLARVRVRRVASELTELERELRELRRERARRRALATEAVSDAATDPLVP
jgi:hypothetical protein